MHSDLSGTEITVRTRIPDREVLAALAEGNAPDEVLRAAFHFRGLSQKRLFALARQQRERFFPGRLVEARSVIEISNICKQRCTFCNFGGVPAKNHYVISLEEVLHLADFIYSQGRRVLMLQSGEYPNAKFLRHVIQCVSKLRNKYADLDLILCLGNLKRAEYRALKEAGANRYILKFETANPEHYATLKPRDTLEQRLACLEEVIDAGFKVGAGNMVGFPGQTVDDLVDDLRLLGRYRLHMSSCSVFIPGEQSQLAGQPMGNADWALNMIALMRILYPSHLIPTTSPLERARKNGQFLGLQAGANTVTIHDGTPPHLKDYFPIYSVMRFSPTNEHIAHITAKAGLRFAPGPLHPRKHPQFH